MQDQSQNQEMISRGTCRSVSLLFGSCLLVGCLLAAPAPQSLVNSAKRFEMGGLVFDYTQNWEVNEESNSAAQQLVLRPLQRFLRLK